MTSSTAIRGGTVVTASGAFDADVLVAGRRIVSVGDVDGADRLIDASGCYVLPGGVDTHTHLENPALGITRSADDFTSGTVAAAHGGTTTIVDFVKKEPDASLYDSFSRRRARAESAVVVDIGFHPVVPPNALDDCSFGDLERLTREHGTTSWKFFMAYPGALMVDDPTLIAGMRRCAELGVLPMVHAENGHLVADATARLVADGKTAEHYHHDAHPHFAEDEAVHRAVAVARTVGSALFVVHVSSRVAAAEIAAARAEGLPVFGETCPQYLLRAFEDYRDLGFEAAAYLCSPPIREAANQQPLWTALATGVLSTIGTDHAPFTMAQPDDLPPQKPHGRGCFTKVPNGVPGVEERLMVIYEAGVGGGWFDVCRFVDLVATRPAKLFGLYPQKGAVIAGADADLVVWDPSAPRVIRAAELHHRADYSLYDGMEVRATPRWVLSRGDVVVSPDGADLEPGRGRYLAAAGAAAVMKFPLGIHVGERLSLEQTWAQAEFADSMGFESVWVAEGRLARDGIVPAAVIASRTRRIRVGTGVVNNKTRNVGLMAVTFKTLDELAPGRIVLGIGAWWEPLASKLGTPLRKPLTAMREYIGSLRTFFANDVVDVDGEFVEVHGARFDSMYRRNEPVPMPIYIGAVGPRMLELAGEIADGVHLDFLLPTSYLVDAKAAISKGESRRDPPLAPVTDITQIVSCSVDDDDPQGAIDACKSFLTMYLMQQPHIGEHCGAEPDLVERIKQVAGWPATPDDVKRAMPLVSNELVRRVTACGSTDDALAALAAYHEAGVRCPIISTLGDNEQTLRKLAEAAQ